MTKITKIIEIIIFFIIIPALLIPVNSNVTMFTTLSSVAVICFFYLRYKKINLFDKNEFKFDQSLLQIFYKAFVIAILILIFSYIFDKEKFLNLPKSHFFLWVMILILYPIFSAFPQEIIYRKFFFQRYRKLFKDKKTFILLNAFLFSFAHIIYLNPIVIIFTFLGGLLMAISYSNHKSLFKVSVEHGLYGNIVFSSGLGNYFYHTQGLSFG
jgi:membrane protease YdiL (CAAX protease family)